MLPSSNDVFSVVLGSESSSGIVSVLRPETVIIDMSSCDPLRTRGLGEILAEQLQVPVPLGRSCLNVWNNAAADSDKTVDHTEMYKIITSK